MKFAEELGLLLEGLVNTVIVSALTIVIALILGAMLGAVRYARTPVLSQLAGVFITVVRATPLIVQIFLVYYALPEVGITLTPFTAALISLSLWGAAYQAEVFRAGYESVGKGEVLAARALGMTGIATFKDVTLPIGLRVSIGPAVTNAITMFRSSSFMSAIGFVELTFVANNIVSRSFEVFKIFGLAALMYLIVSTTFSYLGRLLERKLRIPGMKVN